MDIKLTKFLPFDLKMAASILTFSCGSSHRPQKIKLSRICREPSSRWVFKEMWRILEIVPCREVPIFPGPYQTVCRVQLSSMPVISVPVYNSMPCRVGPSLKSWERQRSRPHGSRGQRGTRDPYPSGVEHYASVQ